MRENLKDILANLNTDIDQETLLLYLQGQLSDEMKHEVEKKLMENDFDGDALEGLEQISDKKQISYMVEMLNRDLKKESGEEKTAPPEISIERSILALPDGIHPDHTHCDQLYDHSPDDGGINFGFLILNFLQLMRSYFIDQVF